MKRQPSPVPDDGLPTSKKLRASPSPSSSASAPLNTNEQNPKNLPASPSTSNEQTPNKEQPSEQQEPPLEDKEPPPEFVNWSPVIRELRLRREPPCFTEMSSLGKLITVQLAIAKDKRLPPSYELNEKELSSLQQDFGEKVIDELDAL